MKAFFTAVAMSATCFTSAASATTIDFLDGVFTGSGAVSTGFTQIQEVADGVTFTFVATQNQSGGARFLTGSSGLIDNGLHLGGGGGSTIEFEFSVSEDVTLTGYSSNTGGGFALQDPTFDLLDGATILVDDAVLRDPTSTNIFNTSGENDVVVTGLSVALRAGSTYIFDVDNTGAGTQSFLTALEFDTASPVAPVPLPAGLPLLLAGLGGLSVLRRARSAR